MDIPATSIAGLKVKARNAKFWADHMWKESDEDADWADLVVRKLIDDILSIG